MPQGENKMTMHSTVLRERGLIWMRAFTSRASALAVLWAVSLVAMLLAGVAEVLL